MLYGIDKLKLVTAKKNYRCDITYKEIIVGEKYWRINLNRVGIFHFKKHLDRKQIANHIEHSEQFKSVTDISNDHYDYDEF